MSAEAGHAAFQPAPRMFCNPAGDRFNQARAIRADDSHDERNVHGSVYGGGEEMASAAPSAKDKVQRKYNIRRPCPIRRQRHKARLRSAGVIECQKTINFGWIVNRFWAFSGHIESVLMIDNFNRIVGEP